MVGATAPACGTCRPVRWRARDALHPTIFLYQSQALDTDRMSQAYVHALFDHAMKPPPSSPHIKPLDFVLPEITGLLLLLLRELAGVDCDKEVARAMARLAVARYWHFRLLDHTRKYDGRPRTAYFEQLQAGRVLCSPQFVFGSAYRMRLCLNHLGEARLGGGAMNPYADNDCNERIAHDDVARLATATRYKGWLSCGMGHAVDVTFCADRGEKLPRFTDIRFYTNPSRCDYMIEMLDEDGLPTTTPVTRRALQL